MQTATIDNNAVGLDKVQYPLSEMNFKPTKQQLDECLNRPESKELLRAMPNDVREIFLRMYYGISQDFEADRAFVRGWFLANSEISRIVKAFPSSGHTFKTLYREPGCDGKGIIDPYFAKSSAGSKIHDRKESVKSYLKTLIPRLFTEKSRPIKIDDVASGDSRALSELLEENPDLINMVSIRSIDIDQTILDVLGTRLNELDCQEKTRGIKDAFELCCVTASAAPCREADIVLVVGVICGLTGEDSVKPLFLALCFGGPDAILLVSAAQVEMGLGDPLTVLIMLIMGWYMRLKTMATCFDLVRQAGWKPSSDESFYDSKLHYHAMVVAHK